MEKQNTAPRARRGSRKQAGGLTEVEFTLRAIKTLRKQGYKGIHTRYSGFNEAFREHFGKDPVVATKAMAKAGSIQMRPCRGGAMLYLPGEMPEAATGNDALTRILAG